MRGVSTPLRRLLPFGVVKGNIYVIIRGRREGGGVGIDNKEKHKYQDFFLVCLKNVVACVIFTFIQSYSTLYVPPKKR